MIRIHFTFDDLARIRIVASFGPLAETIFGLTLVSRPDGSVLRDWHRRTLAQRELWNQPMREAAGLCCPVDLLTLTGAARSLDDGLAALADIPGDDLRAEVATGLRAVARTTVGRRSVPPWVPLARELPHDSGARIRLAAALRSCAHAIVTPAWDHMQVVLTREVAHRAQQLLDGGICRVLSTLNARLRWRAPVLEVWTDRPGSSDLHLRGRGLVLVPSVLGREVVSPFVSLVDPAASPVLFYPAAVEPVDVLRLISPPDPDRTDVALTDLLGRGRAAVLRAAGAGGNTSELAARANLSIASASQHASVLRRSGLITSVRTGAAMRHTATPLGRSLLESAR